MKKYLTYAMVLMIPTFQINLVSATPSITAAEAKVKFRGTLIIPPLCTFNNGEPLLVEFKNIKTTLVDGTNYRELVDYKITCESPGESPPLDMALILTTSLPGFDSSVTGTSIPGLGIRLELEGNPVEFGRDYPLNIQAPPSLTAVPVKYPDEELEAGEFEASITITALYI